MSVCSSIPWHVESSLSSYKAYSEEDVGGRNVGKDQEQEREDKWLLDSCLDNSNDCTEYGEMVHLLSCQQQPQLLQLPQL